MPGWGQDPSDDEDNGSSRDRPPTPVLHPPPQQIPAVAGKGRVPTRNPPPPGWWGLDIPEIIADTVAEAASVASKSLSLSPVPLGGRIYSLKGLHLHFVCKVAMYKEVPPYRARRRRTPPNRRGLPACISNSSRGWSLGIL